ncbi:hypothetical protein GCM10027286_05250 [Virgibacillus ainsalahensis]
MAAIDCPDEIKAAAPTTVKVTARILNNLEAQGIEMANIKIEKIPMM